MNKKKKISIIIPVLNEKHNINYFFKELNASVEKLSKKYNFEYIFNDNHSSDGSFEMLKILKKNNKNKKIKLNRFSKNIGYQNSIFYGYKVSSGDAVIQIDCDMQDPPSLIKKLIFYWEKDFDVVYGIRSTTKDFFIIKFFRKFFYRLINFLSNENLPIDAGDFRLVDKKIVNLLRNVDDKSIYIRGLIATFGFKQTGFTYNRKERLKGYSKFGLYDLFKLAFDGILNHSIMPLRLASFVGLLISLLTVLGILIYSILKLSIGIDWPAGFTTLTVLILFSIALNAIFLGIIGEYLGRIYIQVKKTPSIIIEESL